LIRGALWSEAIGVYRLRPEPNIGL